MKIEIYTDTDAVALTAANRMTQEARDTVGSLNR